VDAPVMRLGRIADGSIQVPPLADHDLTGWYDRSVTPGQDGTSVILGHVDSVAGIYANTRYPGLRLITCGGPFDGANRQYLDNIVVYSHLAG
jgi:hypothetical protein